MLVFIFTKSMKIYTCCFSHSVLLDKLASYRLDGWSVQWVTVQVMAHTQRVVISGFYLGWQSVTNASSRKHLQKLNEEQHCRQPHQVYWWESWWQGGHVRKESKNQMKFNKFKVLHLGQQNQRAQNRPGSVLGEEHHWKGPGALGGWQLATSQQCLAAATKVNWILGCICRGLSCNGRDFTIPLSACQAALGVVCLVLAPTIQERCKQTGEGPEGPWRLPESCRACSVKEDWRS